MKYKGFMKKKVHRPYYLYDRDVRKGQKSKIKKIESPDWVIWAAYLG